jgi:hypothetical protein
MEVVISPAKSSASLFLLGERQFPQGALFLVILFALAFGMVSGTSFIVMEFSAWDRGYSGRVPTFGFFLTDLTRPACIYTTMTNQIKNRALQFAVPTFIQEVHESMERSRKPNPVYLGFLYRRHQSADTYTVGGFAFLNISDLSHSFSSQPRALQNFHCSGMVCLQFG